MRSLLPLTLLGAAAPGLASDPHEPAARPGAGGRCGTLLLDHDGAMLFADAAAEDTLGLPQGQEDDPALVWLGRNANRGVLETVRAALASGEPAHLRDHGCETCTGGARRLDFEIVPGRAVGRRRDGVLIVVREPGAAAGDAMPPERLEGRPEEAERSLAVYLETLRSSEEELRASCDELERTNERLQADIRQVAGCNAGLLDEQRALRARIAELTAGLDAVALGVLVVTGEGRIAACNTAAAERFGGSVAALVGLPLSALIEIALEAHDPDSANGGVPRFRLRGRHTARRLDGTRFLVDLDQTRTSDGERMLLALTLPEPAAGGSEGGPAEDGELRLDGGLELTPREREVMRLLVEGRQSKEIAHRLGISRRTVDVHRARLMRKSGTRSVADLVRLALSERLS